jgi:hypothetical protein
MAVNAVEAPRPPYATGPLHPGRPLQLTDSELVCLAIARTLRSFDTDAGGPPYPELPGTALPVLTPRPAASAAELPGASGRAITRPARPRTDDDVR